MTILEITTIERIFGSAYPIVSTIITVLIIIAGILLAFSLLNLYSISAEIKNTRIVLSNLVKIQSKILKRIESKNNNYVLEDDDDDEIDDDNTTNNTIEDSLNTNQQLQKVLNKLIEEQEIRMRFSQNDVERATIKSTLDSLNKELNSASK